MKKIVAMLAVMVLLQAAVLEVSADDDPKPPLSKEAPVRSIATPPPKSTGSEALQDEDAICSSIKSTTMEAVITEPQQAQKMNKNAISVYLSERLGTVSGPFSGWSCSKIINCMRSNTDPKFKYPPGETGTINEALVEASVIDALRTHFKECIVEGKDGLDLLRNYASRVYTWIAGVVGAVCILIIVVSGIQISMGGVSQEEVSAAKDRIIRSLVGLVVLFLSAFILYTINPIFFT